MASIQLLDQNTINKIAAGEVVERPASVIKELVENAIDAGADNVTVEVKDGGLKLIRITDNGSGISRDEIRTAFLRHSTSKIRAASDLLDIHSLGFRGEALASIAAVSMVELITKQAADMTGIRYVIEGGNEKAHEEIGCPTGTTFVVKEIFYNTPARLKFMKTASTELGYISDLLNKLAMGHPEIGFKLISNGKTKLHTTGNNKMLDAIYAVYGKDVARNLIEIDHGNEAMKVYGYIGKPHISRGNRSYENYYINGRYIKSKVIEKAIEDAFKSRLMQHRYPFVSFHMDILSKDVDVNVHPTKMEVRFMSEEEVYRLVFESINRALNAKEMIPQVEIDRKKPKSGTQDVAEFDKVAGTSLTKVKSSEVVGENGNQNKKPKEDRYEPFEVKGAAKVKEISTASALGYGVSSEKISVEDKGNNNDKTPGKSEPAFVSLDNRLGRAVYDYKAPGRQNNASGKYSAEKPVTSNVGKDNADHTQDRAKTTPRIDLMNISKSDYTKATGYGTEPDRKPILPEVKKAPVIPGKDHYKGDQVAMDTSAFVDSSAVKSHKIIGQLFDTYWIVELEEKYYLIDQHAAHEKVLYERMLKKLETKVEYGQRLLRPVVVDVTLQEMGRYEAHKKLFADLGFEVELFGEESLIIRSVPFVFNKIMDAGQFIQILDTLEDSYNEDKYAVLLDDIATMSCKAAVKGNDKLTKAEYIQLIDDLLTLDDPFHCPHGRPTIIAMTRYELEKKFKRIQ